ncbi:MAG: methylated-DNA--[protein]-cysteine S-methyltransferase [Gallionellaceae bacterium]
MKTTNQYQAKLIAPFGVLGIVCKEDTLTGVQFLAADTVAQAPQSRFAKEVCKQLAAYFEDADFTFSIPIKFAGTAHQNKVWQAMRAIPRGQTRQYGELARELASSPRAVGQACGANPIPIVIPCHRVVSKTGMGGFAHQRDGYELGIKRWLLAHEQR